MGWRMDVDLPGSQRLSLKAHDMVCAAGEDDYDLYVVEAGRVLVFVNDNTRITPLSTIGPGEYLGEFAFFDRKPRSAHAVCIENSTLIKVGLGEIQDHIPQWIASLAQHFTGKVRRANGMIAKQGIRKTLVETVPALSIEDQRTYYRLLMEYKKNNALP